MQKREFQLSLAGKILTATFTDMTEQANGSVLMRLGNTTVLVTAVMSRERGEADFFPLTVEYEERFYASGQILGGQYVRREGRPSEEATLSARAIDRTIRPLFNQKIRREIQVVVTTLSIDNENDPDVLGIIGTSLALAASDIPWEGPVGALRIAKLPSGVLVVNPTRTERTEATLEVLACAKEGKLIMLEAEAKEANEADAEVLFRQALEVSAEIEAWQHKIVREIGKPKTVPTLATPSTALEACFATAIMPRLASALFSGISGKKAIHALRTEWVALAHAQFPHESDAVCGTLFDEAAGLCLHKGAIAEGKRADGRAFDEVRPLFAEAGGLSSVLHGSGLFYRGGTHVLSVLTLGGPREALQLEGAEVSRSKHFMHHYNFPPYSAGETGRMGSVNRRAIGHGALAEKALRATLPTRDTFPYTIRLVSESLASNGSTSMAAVCASTLALMDGGVPIVRPTAGVAIGLMMKQSPDTRAQNHNEFPEYRILTDIQGPEDEHGDMDLKVAGTRAGITAIQMDIKVDGIPPDILVEALASAKKARARILDTIEAALPRPRATLQPSAGHISTA